MQYQKVICLAGTLTWADGGLLYTARYILVYSVICVCL